MSRSQNAAGRHRSAGRRKTPLNTIANAARANVNAMSRRSAVFAATSGLAMTMGIPAANAAPNAAKSATAPERALDNSQDFLLGGTAPQQVAVGETVVIDFAGATVTSATAPAPVAAQAAPAPVAPAAQADQDAAPRQERPSRAKARPVVKDTTDEAPAQRDDAAPQSRSGSAVLAIAERYLGVPYLWGGTTPSGFDCSGYVQYVYRQVGVDLPRDSSGQAAYGRRISASEARPGDLVYKPGHIGIFAGDGMMYHSPHTGSVVKKAKIYFTPQYIRVL